jgi:hypothetical protein
MTENRRLYAAIGYQEIGRGTEAGYERVFMRKRLAGQSYKRTPCIRSVYQAATPTIGWRRATALG